MSCKCRICNSNEVENFGDICELCAIGADPYLADMTEGHSAVTDDGGEQEMVHPKSSGIKARRILLGGGSSVPVQESEETEIAERENADEVQVYEPGSVPQTPPVNTSGGLSQSPQNPVASGCITAGITKNIMVDHQKRSFLEKWFGALFKGIPFTLDDDVTMFQVFPDYSGTTLNAMGNACDQVIVYGKLNNGEVSENNDVEVFGRRDSRNNIIAQMIRNKATGTTIKPMRVLGAGLVRTITLLAVALIVAAVGGLGVEGLLWALFLVLCLTNLPLVFKVAGAVVAFLVSLIKRMF